MPILLDPGVLTPPTPPALNIPGLLVELDLGNYLSGGKWDEDEWDTTFIWGPVAPTYPIDITEFVREISTSRGTQRELQRIGAGTAEILLDNRDNRFTPFVTTSPYYPNIKPMRRIRIQATWESVTFPVFMGFVESWPVEFPEDVDQVTRVRLVDGFTVLARQTISGSFPEQLSGTRVGTILDMAGWLTADRDVDVGIVTVPGVTLENVSPLEHIQQIEYAEGGRFFMGRDGRATFRDRGSEANVDLSTRTWADDGTGMSYRDGVVLPYDDELIVNDVRLIREGGVEQVAGSQSSQDTYGPRSAQEAGFQTTGIQLSSDAQVADLADHILARFAEPQLRIEQFVDNAIRHQFWERVLGREINDTINVIESRTSTAQVSSIEGITHDLRGKEWTVTFSLSPTTILQAGIWDDPVYGLWDSSFIWAR